MKIVYSPLHARHHGRGELTDGQLVPCHERPERVEMIKAALEQAGMTDFVAPAVQEDAALARVHAPNYLAFLHKCWPDWVAARGMREAETPDALPLIFPVRDLRAVPPNHIDGRVSYYAMDAGTPVMAGTWDAARESAFCALTALDLVLGGEPAAFALSRPPGHHASRDVMGGYCYLNNAAIAAQAARDRGAARVAILDVDYHHGNGTQALFYDRDDVLVINLHADPREEFPYFLGYADETGSGAGEGFTLNLPMPLGTRWDRYAEALETACARIADYAPDVLIVSFGFDAYEGDPISQFKLTRQDFAKIGARIAKLGLPSVIQLEGGYAVEALGDNVVSGLTGFLES